MLSCESSFGNLSIHSSTRLDLLSVPFPLSTTAVAAGDLSKSITVDAQGEILQLKVRLVSPAYPFLRRARLAEPVVSFPQNTVNNMVESLNNFSSEVTRVAKEVGTYGQLGGQARVDGVSGTWKDLTDNVSSTFPRRVLFEGKLLTSTCCLLCIRSTSWLPI